MFINMGLGKSLGDSNLLLNRANRHGMVAGATGTGKTITLQCLAEQFSENGVPVFATDVKGDLCGISAAGTFNSKLTGRAEELGLVEYAPTSYPAKAWDIFCKNGHPIKATVQDMGPLVMGRLLNLTSTQLGVLNVVFSMCNSWDLSLYTLDDFRYALRYAAANTDKVSYEFGYLSASTIGILQRNLTSLENQGGASFFGLPEFDVHDFMQVVDGKGQVNLLASWDLLESPQVYAGFIMWLMQKLFRTLPEVGDPEKPKIVFFFDEAHLLFKNANPDLIDTVERVVRLIRSKGVGIYFVTQSPTDVPESILGQLGNRYQHALRAFTAKDQKAVKAAADTFRPNPAFNTKEEIGNLATGTALVSTLSADSSPQPVDVVKIRPPKSHIGPVDNFYCAVDEPADSIEPVIVDNLGFWQLDTVGVKQYWEDRPIQAGFWAVILGLMVAVGLFFLV